MQAPADLLAERADQVLLAGVQAAAHAGPCLHHALLLHLAQGAQDGHSRLARHEPLLDQHHRVRLVEGVHGGQHGMRPARGEPRELRQHLLAQQRHAELADRLGLTEGAVKVAVHRLRRRYRGRLRAAIAETVEKPEDVDDEVRDLFAALG